MIVSRALGRPPLPLVVAGIGVAAVTLLPLAHVVQYASTVGWDTIDEQIVRDRTVVLLRNTVGLVLVGTALSVVLATACAWVVERTTIPWPTLWRVLLVAPLAVPAFVNGYAWVSLTHAVEGFAGAVMIASLSYFPLVYLPVTAALRRVDPVLEEASRSLGRGPVATFTGVVLPQLRPALCGGGLLVALHLLSEFGALALLRFPTFTTTVYDQFETTFNGPAAQVSATMLAVLAVLVLAGEWGLRGPGHVLREGPGVRRAPDRLRLGRWTLPAAAGLAAVVALALGVPIAALLRWTLTGSSAAFPVADLVETTLTSLGLAAAAALVGLVLALPVGLLLVRYPGLTGTLVERSTFVGSALPGIVVALAVVSLALDHVPTLYQTGTLLVGVYVVLFLSRAVVGVTSGLRQVPRSLEHASRATGRGPWATFARVTLPLAAPGVAAGGALLFVAVATELTVTLMLAPTGTRTLATQFWSESSALAYGAAAPYALLLVLLSVPATVLLGRSAVAGR